MEILVVANHRNQHNCSGRNRDHGSSKFGPVPSRNTRGINCRTFQSGAGLLRTPLKSCSMTTSDTKNAFPASLPKTPSPPVNENQKGSKGTEKISTPPIPIKTKYEKNEGEFNLSENWSGPAHSYTPSSSLEFHFAERNARPAHSYSPPSSLEIHFSERWAGPAYSNSPPPSSLPIPKFSLRPKRSVSLDLPKSPSEIDFHYIAKSAPVSPTREHSPSPSDLFDSADCATKTLRRILNLDITDE
ncbi:hypothetical protein ACJIZ3_011758 [Penstemon smallii]|uniref:Uncharacterized protein n=1 Tax=Penstemon smallii TaxID=265156 RepID=A0ABD3UK11_9LAMI